MLNLVRLACSFGLAFSSLGSGLCVDPHNDVDHPAAAKRLTTSISCARRLGVHRMVMHPVLIVRVTVGMVSCVVPTFVSLWPTQPSGTIDATCRLMVSVVRASVAQRLHRLVAGRPSGDVRC